MHIFTKTQRVLLGAAVFAALLFAASSVLAATVTSANDYPITLQTSQDADHYVLFTTPSGAAEGDTITLTFSSDFDTSSLTEDDIDITDDSLDLTTAPDCAGSEEASVAIASDIVTITICSGDGGAIAATSAVGIEIGANATASGTGANQVTNPTTLGTYFVSIGGTFGDSGTIALPIDTSSDGVTVSGTVSGGGGGDGGDPVDPPDPVDSTGPVISDVVVSGVTASEATITWTTNETANSRVNYGETDAFGSSESSAFFTTSHSISLSGLSEGVTYSFQIVSADESSNSSTSSTYTFTTLDETAPVISDIEVVDITTSTARITWTTDEEADGLVGYGLTDVYGSEESDSDYETTHSITLSSLDAGQTYHFQITSADASANSTISSDQTFETDSDDAPANVFDLTVSSGDAVLTLTWTNPSDEDLAGVLGIVCLDEYPSSYDDADCTTIFDALTETYTYSGLTNGTTYYFGLFAYDEALQFASGALGMGTPSASEEEEPSEEEPEDDPEEGEGPGEDEGEDPSEEPDDGEDPSEGEPDGEEPSDDEPSEETDDTPGAAQCGDGICSASESSLSCPADCLVEQEEEGGVEEEERTVLQEGDVHIYASGDSVELTTTSSGVVTALAELPLHLQLFIEDISTELASVQVTIGDDLYLLSEEDGEITDEEILLGTTFVAPQEEGRYLATFTLSYEDESEETRLFSLDIVGPGYTYEVVNGETQSVAPTIVTLYKVDDGALVWDGSPYSQANPFTTNEDGEYGFMVPNGTYSLSAQKDGYEIANTASFTVSNHVINKPILMTALPDEEVVIIEDVEEVIEPEKEKTILESTISETVETVEEALETIREVPGVEEVAEISVPALAATAGASVVVMTVAFDFLPFLQYLFTAPVLLFWRRRRKGFGVVYNAISKLPVDLATVRLYRLPDTVDLEGELPQGKLVKSRVTDKKGRYFFLVPPGLYRLTVTKTGFTFPTEYLKDDQSDGEYLDVYHGEIIKVEGSEALIAANIPTDPSQADAHHAPQRIQWAARMRILQRIVAISGISAAVLFAIIRPTIFAFIMIGVQVVVYLLARRLAKPHKPIRWGIVYDKATGRPLANVVARVFEPKFNKLIETQVTDSKGRYSFLLGSNIYFARFQKDGFKQTEVRPIDFEKKAHPDEFSADIALSPEGGEEAETKKDT